MAKVKKKTKSIKKKPVEEKFEFPLKRTNYMILLTGILILIAGYVLMAIPDHPDAFLSRTFAPVLLVISFLIVIPLGLLYKDKNKKQ